MTRERLDNRRNSENTVLDWNGIKLAVTYGRDTAGSIREVFINAGKIGSEIEVMMSDAATAFSLALQNNCSPSELYKSMAKDDKNKPSSILGFVLRDMVKSNG